MSHFSPIFWIWMGSQVGHLNSAGVPGVPVMDKLTLKAFPGKVVNLPSPIMAKLLAVPPTFRPLTDRLALSEPNSIRFAVAAAVAARDVEVDDEVVF